MAQPSEKGHISKAFQLTSTKNPVRQQKLSSMTLKTNVTVSSEYFHAILPPQTFLLGNNKENHHVSPDHMWRFSFKGLTF